MIDLAPLKNAPQSPQSETGPTPLHPDMKTRRRGEPRETTLLPPSSSMQPEQGPSTSSGAPPAYAEIQAMPSHSPPALPARDSTAAARSSAERVHSSVGALPLGAHEYLKGGEDDDDSDAGRGPMRTFTRGMKAIVYAPLLVIVAGIAAMLGVLYGCGKLTEAIGKGLSLGPETAYEWYRAREDRRAARRAEKKARRQKIRQVAGLMWVAAPSASSEDSQGDLGALPIEGEDIRGFLCWMRTVCLLVPIRTVPRELAPQRRSTLRRRNEDGLGPSTDSAGVKAGKALGIGLLTIVGIPFALAGVGVIAAGGLVWGAGKVVEGVGKGVAALPEAVTRAAVGSSEVPAPEGEESGEKAKKRKRGGGKRNAARVS
ncbi:hypothetical protein C8Q73DRAFT_667760 [Cubamyces lactineus]|nr:hypothetical protein C8Q73DRAFT_667760 [Cubamyces lactineus]